MELILLIIHLLIAIALVVVILLQRSEGGALGIGGGGGGGFMTARGAANLLTRATGILAAAFIGMSLLLAIIAGQDRTAGGLMQQPAPTTNAPAEPVDPNFDFGDLPAPADEPEVPLP